MAHIGPLGWIYHPQAIAAFCERQAKAGHVVAFGDARPDLRGYWQSLVNRGIKGVFHQHSELQVLGRHLPAFTQARGICSSLGTGRAFQDSYFSSLARKGVVGRSALIATEPLYGARIDIGRGGMGRGDGMPVVWCIQFGHDIGLCERGVYGGYDISRPNESLAVEWGNSGVPSAVRAACTHKIRAYQLNSASDMADALAADFSVTGGCNWIWGDRDANGMARPESTGGHCQERNAVFLDARGNLCFGQQQSWGDNSPGGPAATQYDGGRIDWRPGACGVYATDIEQAMHQGEFWALEVVEAWRPDGVGDMV